MQSYGLHERIYCSTAGDLFGELYASTAAAVGFRLKAYLLGPGLRNVVAGSVCEARTKSEYADWRAS